MIVFDPYKTFAQKYENSGEICEIVSWKSCRIFAPELKLNNGNYDTDEFKPKSVIRKVIFVVVFVINW